MDRFYHFWVSSEPSNQGGVIGGPGGINGVHDITDEGSLSCFSCILGWQIIQGSSRAAARHPIPGIP